MIPTMKLIGIVFYGLKPFSLKEERQLFCFERFYQVKNVLVILFTALGNSITYCM